MKSQPMRSGVLTAATAALAGLLISTAGAICRRRTPSPLAAGLILAAAFSWPAAGQAPRPAVTVFEGARLIVGDGSAIEDAAFTVENGRFTAVGRNGQVTVPAGAARVDLSGKTVIPAIVDAHGHPGFVDAVTGQMSKANFTRENYIDHLERYAYHGIAATISTGTDMGELAYKLRAETIPNAALIRTVGLGLAYPGSGPADSSRNDVPYAVTSVAEARRAVQDLAPHKPDFVKIWVDSRNGRQQKLTPEMFAAAADEARKQGLPSIAHVFDLDDAKLLVRAGVEGFLHSIRDQEVDDEFSEGARYLDHAQPRRDQPGVAHARERHAGMVRRAVGPGNDRARADQGTRADV
jgi:imidazolonepropionase-like amidohydrolase